MSNKFTSNLSWLWVACVIVFAIGLSRLFFLSVVMGSHFGNLADRNMIKIEKIKASRGVITDYKGVVLAQNIEHNGKIVRHYPFGEVSSAVLGYMVDGKGVSGLEGVYEKELSGDDGEMLIEETAEGARKSEILRKKPQDGKNLETNIDSRIQKDAFIALSEGLSKTGKSGAVIVSTVDGRIRALVSAPSFDNNLFVDGGKRSDFGGVFVDRNQVVKDENGKPLFNRGISGGFATGSVYKILPALAGLGEKKITKETLFQDSGEIVIGQYRFGNWLLDKYGQTEGEINVVRAIARSNDIFFYKLGEALGIDKLYSWSKRFGLGEKTGVDLTGEIAGLMPSPYWKEKIKGEKWFLGNTYHLAIGQGDLQTTPIQVSRMTAGVVSGKLCEPRVWGRGSCKDLGVSKTDIDVVLEGMKETCMKGGTAFPFYEYGGSVYCKTGTAQKGGEETLPNAWFSMVVPRGGDVNEWLVVTVLVEEGGEGSAVAAPIAKEVYKTISSQ